MKNGWEVPTVFKFTKITINTFTLITDTNIERGERMIEGSNFVGLSDLLDQDITSYEFFYSLPKELQDEIKKHDFSSFEAMTEFVRKKRNG